MKIQLSYNDLKILLTRNDLKQIEEMPTPSLEQAKMMKETWDISFGDRTVKETSEAIQHGIIWLKPFMKCYKTYPQLFI